MSKRVSRPFDLFVGGGGVGGVCVYIYVCVYVGAGGDYLFGVR